MITGIDSSRSEIFRLESAISQTGRIFIVFDQAGKAKNNEYNSLEKYFFRDMYFCDSCIY